MENRASTFQFESKTIYDENPVIVVEHPIPQRSIAFARRCHVLATLYVPFDGIQATTRLLVTHNNLEHESISSLSQIPHPNAITQSLF